jgi:hypothetical protein
MVTEVKMKWNRPAEWSQLGDVGYLLVCERAPTKPFHFFRRPVSDVLKGASDVDVTIVLLPYQRIGKSFWGLATLSDFTAVHPVS